MLIFTKDYVRESLNKFFFVTAAYDCMDAGDTMTRMSSVESRRERRPRATQQAKAEAGVQKNQ
jgi:hypothetical protein